MIGFALFGAGRIGRMHAENLALSRDARVSRSMAFGVGGKRWKTELTDGLHSASSLSAKPKNTGVSCKNDGAS